MNRDRTQKAKNSGLSLPPMLEPLEQRRLLSATHYVVDSLLDIVSGADEVVTLREALEAANTNTAVTDDVQAGSATEADLISFDRAALQAEAGAGNSLVITLAGTELAITDDVTIQGPDGMLGIDAAGLSRVFRVDSGVTARLADLEITGGQTAGNGGGISNSGTLSLEGVKVGGNSAVAVGGGIYNRGDLTIGTGQVSGNESLSLGGGIYNSELAGARLSDLTLSGNTANYGGGLFINGYFGELSTVDLIRVAISGNSVQLEGGGIYNASNLRMVSTEVLGNRSGRHGAGIYFTGEFGGSVSAANTAIVGNFAHGVNSRGGGLYSTYLGQMALENSTIVANRATVEGGGIFNQNSSVLLENSIVTLNSAGSVDEIDGLVTTSASLIGTDAGFIRNPSDGGDGWGDDPATSGVDESANDDYGDLQLAPGSAAIDAGNSALLPADVLDVDSDTNTTEVLPLDLAGGVRVSGSAVDLGAYERPAAQVVGRHVFYNNSAGDGFDASPGASDDQAIDETIEALLPGQVGSGANVTATDLGLNGLMVDLSGIPDAAELSDADFLVHFATDAAAPVWVAQNPEVTLREGDGIGGSDRITLILPDGSLTGGWVRVTVPATARTTLAQQDVFYFGNLPGDFNSDMVVDDVDAGQILSHYRLTQVDIEDGDITADGQVGLADVRSLGETFGDSLSALTPPQEGLPTAPPMPETLRGTETTETTLAPQQEILATDLSLTAADAESPAVAESASDSTGRGGSSLWGSGVSLLDEASAWETLPAAPEAVEAPSAPAVMNWSDQGLEDASLTDLMAELDPSPALDLDA